MIIKYWIKYFSDNLSSHSLIWCEQIYASLIIYYDYDYRLLKM